MNYYEILNADCEASGAEIKAAYMKLALKVFSNFSFNCDCVFLLKNSN